MQNLKHKSTLSLIVIILAALIISGCRSSEPAIDIDAEKTGFAQTAEIQATMTAGAQPTATETPPPTPTNTSTPDFTPTPRTTATKQSGETTAPLPGNDAAEWLANDPPDNTVFSPGETFTITWTIENVGSSTWTTNYYIEFVSGDQMGAPEKVNLPYQVPPGTNVQISVQFTAPETTGEKRSNWQLVNANDGQFYAFYIIINVEEGGGSEPASPTETPIPTEDS